MSRPNKKDDKVADDGTKKKPNLKKKESIFSILKGMVTSKKLTEEEKKTLVICNRQKALESNEIKEDWRVVFGEEAPKKKKDIFTVKGVTLRKLWMDPLFLYEAITGLHAEQCRCFYMYFYNFSLV
jgi:hypothetical protein